MATLERREQTPGNVTYRVRWRSEDKQRSKSFKGYDDARRFKAVLEGDMVNGSFIDPKAGQVTLQCFMTDHADALLVDVRASTAHRIQGIYRTHVIPEFGHLPLNAITRQDVAKWINTMLKTHNASSVRKNVFALKRVLDLAVSYGLLRINPATGVKLPAEPRHEQRFLTQEQANDLAECVPDRYKAMVQVAVFGGLRFGEITALQRQDINPVSSQIKVRRTAVDIKGEITLGEPKTKTSVRTVTIPRSIMTALIKHMEKYTTATPESLVFTGQRGLVVRRTWFYRSYWQPCVQSVGLDGLRFHDLRHTFVALWVSLGRNAKEVSRAAGHSSVAFTLDRYGHLYEQDDDGLADRLDALLAV